jgi:hypothetical protein
MGEISVLSPPAMSAEEKSLRKSMINGIVRKIVVNAAIHRPGCDIMAEVYFAGLYHAAKLSGPAARKPDIIDITPPPRRRGRRRSIKDDGPTAA